MLLVSIEGSFALVYSRTRICKSRFLRHGRHRHACSAFRLRGKCAHGRLRLAGRWLLQLAQSFFQFSQPLGDGDELLDQMADGLFRRDFAKGPKAEEFVGRISGHTGVFLSV